MPEQTLEFFPQYDSLILEDWATIGFLPCENIDEAREKIEMYKEAHPQASQVFRIKVVSTTTLYI